MGDELLKYIILKLIKRGKGFNSDHGIKMTTELILKEKLSVNIDAFLKYLIEEGYIYKDKLFFLTDKGAIDLANWKKLDLETILKERNVSDIYKEFLFKGLN